MSMHAEIGEGESAAPASHFRQAKRGGRCAPRTPSPGDHVGASVVGREVEPNDKRDRRFEITCGHCGSMQIRTSSQINFSLRRSLTVACPRCVSEGYVVRSIARSDKILERVLEGGPLYTGVEILSICEDVWNDLVAQCGPVKEENPSLDPAAGYPYSANEMTEAKRILENYKRYAVSEEEWRAYQKKLEAERVAKTERDYREALRQHYLREQREFSERADAAARALERVVQLGGSIESGSDEDEGLP